MLGMESWGGCCSHHTDNITVLSCVFHLQLRGYLLVSHNFQGNPFFLWLIFRYFLICHFIVVSLQCTFFFKNVLCFWTLNFIICILVFPQCWKFLSHSLFKPYLCPFFLFFWNSITSFWYFLISLIYFLSLYFYTTCWIISFVILNSEIFSHLYFHFFRFSLRLWDQRWRYLTSGEGSHLLCQQLRSPTLEDHSKPKSWLEIAGELHGYKFCLQICLGWWALSLSIIIPYLFPLCLFICFLRQALTISSGWPRT